MTKRVRFHVIVLRA